VPTEIGRVIGTERRPNTAYTFYFWTEPSAPVGIGSIVKVESEGGTVFGTVVEAHGFNDLESPLHEYLSLSGQPELEPPTLRPEMRVFQGAVLRREPEEPVGAVPIGRVFLAEEADVQKALRCDDYKDECGIPCGVFGPKDSPVPVYLHSRFLLGSEAGHLNMTGTSGLAAKTSYILFLLKSIFRHYKDEPGHTSTSGVAALLFNTKGGDLLYLDRDSTEATFATKLTEDQRTVYELCGIDPVPFPSVRYFAPYAKDFANLNTLRRNEELEVENPTLPFTFGLRDVIRHAEVLLNRDDLDAKADAYLEYMNDRYVEDKHQVGRQGDAYQADTLDELLAIVDKQIAWCEQNGKSDHESHSIFTIRKMKNRLRGLGGRFGGLIAERGKPSGPFDEDLQAGTVYVVDVAGLDSESQDLVFAAFVTQLRERMESQTLGVSKLVVMVDELNKYAPSGGRETYVVKSLKDIAARGRYLGLTLFGAQQFRSRVDKEVVGNAATHAFGHVESEELAQPGYSYFSPAMREKLGSLPPGEILIKHPHFAQPVFLRFPPPPVLKGSDGMRRYPQRPEEPLEDILLRELKRFSTPFNVLKDKLDNVSPEPRERRKLLRELKALPSEADPSRAFMQVKAVVNVASRTEPRPFVGQEVEEDPFAELKT